VSIKLCIDAGHGGRDSGAVGILVEKQITLAIALKVKKLSLMREYKNRIEIIMTREEDRYISLKDRCKIANENKCDYFISIHCNSSKKPTEFGGIEVFYYRGSKKGNYLAYHIINNILKRIFILGNRGTKRGNFYVLRHTIMPACLVECGFVNNETDAEILTTYQYEYAEGIINAVINAHNTWRNNE